MYTFSPEKSLNEGVGEGEVEALEIPPKLNHLRHKHYKPASMV